jgi:hypothetical protein
MPLGFLVAMQTDFAFTSQTSNLKSVFLEFSLHLLKFSPVFLMDLS